MKTRQGNYIPPITAPIRESIKIKCDNCSLCGTCVHLLDDCKTQARHTRVINDYLATIQCSGYEQLGAEEACK